MKFQQQHVSSGEERRAHNPEVPGSKPGHAIRFLFFFLFVGLIFIPLYSLFVLSLAPAEIDWFFSQCQVRQPNSSDRA